MADDERHIVRVVVQQIADEEIEILARLELAVRRRIGLGEGNSGEIDEAAAIDDAVAEFGHARFEMGVRVLEIERGNRIPFGLCENGLGSTVEDHPHLAVREDFDGIVARLIEAQNAVL